MADSEPREHGLIFGRGDELPAGTDEPPLGPPPVLPWYGSPVPFGSPPDEAVELAGDIPWELRDPPQTKPTIL